MGQVVTVMNMKGGVGKTTVAMHIGGALGYYKWRDKKALKVLLIDYDPQFNLSQAFLKPERYFSLEENKKTVLEVLQEDADDLDPYKIQVPCTSIPPSVSELAENVWSYRSGSGLDIVPSTLDLMYIALGRVDSQISVIEKRFKKFIDQCRESYDLVVIDCHPAGSLMTKTALSNSDHVLIPVVPERYAVRGIGLMMDFIKSKKKGAQGPTPHILFNRVPRTGTAHQEVEIRSNKNYSTYCLLRTIKKYSAFSDPEYGAGFVWTSSKPYSAQARSNIQSVAFEFANRIEVW